MCGSILGFLYFGKQPSVGFRKLQHLGNTSLGQVTVEVVVGVLRFKGEKKHAKLAK